MSHKKPSKSTDAIEAVQKKNRASKGSSSSDSIESKGANDWKHPSDSLSLEAASKKHQDSEPFNHAHGSDLLSNDSKTSGKASGSDKSSRTITQADVSSEDLYAKKTETKSLASKSDWSQQSSDSSLKSTSQVDKDAVSAKNANKSDSSVATKSDSSNSAEDMKKEESWHHLLEEVRYQKSLLTSDVAGVSVKASEVVSGLMKKFTTLLTKEFSDKGQTLTPSLKKAADSIMAIEKTILTKAQTMFESNSKEVETKEKTK